MKGILLNDDDDLLIEIPPTGGPGRMVVGDCRGQLIHTLLRANKGEFKHEPLLGAGATQLLGGTPSLLWCAETKDMLVSCLVDVVNVEFGTDNTIIVE